MSWKSDYARPVGGVIHSLLKLDIVSQSAIRSYFELPVLNELLNTPLSKYVKFVFVC
jgi:hypothetical protein